MGTAPLTIRPATPKDKIKIFNWLAHSNLTSKMLGPPKFPENPVPTWDEFDRDYHDYYFDGSQPLKGQCFIIIYNEHDVGQINYNEIDMFTNSTELDIWLAEKQFTGKRLGTEAIKILCDYLYKSFDCNTFYIAPSGQNANAIKSYQKAGFIETSVQPTNFIADYNDTVLMVKTRI